MRIVANLIIFMGITLVLFATSMAEPMTNVAFVMQILFIIIGLLSAIMGGLLRRQL